MFALDTFAPSITPEALYDLKAAVQGAVIVPGDAAYEERRQAWNRAYQHEPALIVVARSAADVAAAVRFASTADLPVAVQSTGHGVIRPAQNALLIVTSEMKEICVDAATHTAWIEAGAQWGEVLVLAQAAGLAPLLGSSPNVGAVGYTLGGGMGWLARKYGLALDSVDYFELVTADGRLVRASETENSDLFWGLRGGGGGFGVITGMGIRLYPVTTIYGGNLLYPIEDAREVYTRYREWIKSAPDELTSSIVLMNMPPIPQVPDFLRGKTVVFIKAAYAGEAEKGAQYIQDWLDWKPPMMNTFQAMPFADVATISNDPKDPSPSLSTGGWLRDLDDETIDTLLAWGVSVQGSSPFTVVEIRHAGGAIARVDKHANAYSNRDETLLLNLIGMTPTPERYQTAQEYGQAFKQALGDHLTGGVYMNFMGGEEARERTRDGYLPENFARLQALKTRHDPQNRFRFGYDIPPAANSN